MTEQNFEVAWGWDMIKTVENIEIPEKWNQLVEAFLKKYDEEAAKGKVFFNVTPWMNKPNSPLPIQTGITIYMDIKEKVQYGDTRKAFWWRATPNGNNGLYLVQIEARKSEQYLKEKSSS